MIDLFYTGGSLFMGGLTILLLIVLVIAIFNAIKLLTQKSLTDFSLDAVKSVGLFAMVFGILGQLYGLFSAFDAIEQLGEVSQAMLAGGLKVSSISTIYGLIIFLISYLIWFGQKFWKGLQENS